MGKSGPIKEKGKEKSFGNIFRFRMVKKIGKKFLGRAKVFAVPPLPFPFATALGKGKKKKKSFFPKILQIPKNFFGPGFPPKKQKKKKTLYIFLKKNVEGIEKPVGKKNLGLGFGINTNQFPPPNRFLASSFKYDQGAPPPPLKIFPA